MTEHFRSDNSFLRRNLFISEKFYIFVNQEMNQQNKNQAGNYN
jgi:hypothetical protein